MPKQILTPRDFASHGVDVGSLPTVVDVPIGGPNNSSLKIDLITLGKDEVGFGPLMEPVGSGTLTFFIKFVNDGVTGKVALLNLLLAVREGLFSSKAFSLGVPPVSDASGYTPNIVFGRWYDNNLFDAELPNADWNQVRILYGPQENLGLRLRAEVLDNFGRWLPILDIVDERLSYSANGVVSFLAKTLRNISEYTQAEVYLHAINHVATVKSLSPFALIASGSFVEPFDADWVTRTIHTGDFQGTSLVTTALSSISLTANGIQLSGGVGNQVFRPSEMLLRSGPYNTFSGVTSYMGSANLEIRFSNGYDVDEDGVLIQRSIAYIIDSSGTVTKRYWWGEGGVVTSITGWDPITKFEEVSIKLDRTGSEPSFTLSRNVAGSWIDVYTDSLLPSWPVLSVGVKSFAINGAPTVTPYPNINRNVIPIGSKIYVDNTPFTVVQVVQDTTPNVYIVYVEEDTAGIVLPATLRFPLQDLFWTFEVAIQPGSELGNIEYRVT